MDHLGKNQGSMQFAYQEGLGATAENPGSLVHPHDSPYTSGPINSTVLFGRFIF